MKNSNTFSRGSNKTWVTSHVELLLKKLKMLKFQDNIAVNNCSFVYDYFHQNLPRSFSNIFFRAVDFYQYSTRQATSCLLYIPYFKTTTFGLKCIFKRCIDSWNQFSTEININNRINNRNNIEIKDIDLLKYSRTVLKDKLTKHILSTYND